MRCESEYGSSFSVIKDCLYLRSYYFEVVLIIKAKKCSSITGNPLLISPERWVEDGLLEETDLGTAPDCPPDRVDFAEAAAYKQKLFKLAYDRFQARGADDEFHGFCHRHAVWLDDFVLFEVLKSHYGGDPWNEWPAEIRDRDYAALAAVRYELSEHLQELKFLQYMFYRQWHDLRRYCRQKHIQIIGDIPIYLPYDSADVWMHPELFKLDEDKRHTGWIPWKKKDGCMRCDKVSAKPIFTGGWIHLPRRSSPGN